VNGITDAMVAGAPTFADLLPRIVDFLSDDPLVFHNAPFDLSFLRSEARLAGGAWPGNRVIDTLTLARRTGRFRSNSLPHICRELGIGSTFHRAEADAWAAGKLLLHLAPPDGIPEPRRRPATSSARPSASSSPRRRSPPFDTPSPGRQHLRPAVVEAPAGALSHPVEREGAKESSATVESR